MRALSLAIAGLLLLPSLAGAQAAAVTGPRILVKDEGTLQGAAAVVNCTGAGVTCSTSGGTWTLNAAGGAGTFAATEVEVDFGSVPVLSAIFTVVDATVGAGAKIVITQSGNAATARQADENQMDFLVCTALPAAGSFTLACGAIHGPVAGKYKLIYAVG